MKHPETLLRSAWVTQLLILLTLGACSEKPATDTGVRPPVAAPLTTETAFAEDMPEAIKGELALRGECNMEKINGQNFSAEPYKVAVNSTLKIAGWVHDVPGGGVPQTAFVRAASEDGKRVWYGPLSLSVERSDLVALRGGDEAYRRSGYDATLKSNALPVGSYRLQVIYSGKTEKAICDNGRTLVIE